MTLFPPVEVIMTPSSRFGAAPPKAALLVHEQGVALAIEHRHDAVLAVPGRLSLQDGQIVRKHSVQDVTVVMTGAFGTVLTVYREAEHPRRNRWRVPMACAA